MNVWGINLYLHKRLLWEKKQDWHGAGMFGASMMAITWRTWFHVTSCRPPVWTAQTSLQYDGWAPRQQNRGFWYPIKLRSEILEWVSVKNKTTKSSQIQEERYKHSLFLRGVVCPKGRMIGSHFFREPLHREQLLYRLLFWGSCMLSIYKPKAVDSLTAAMGIKSV